MDSRSKLEFLIEKNHYSVVSTCSILGKQLNHQDRRNMIENLNSDSMQILSQVLEEMKEEQGKSFVLNQVNLSELQRRTGISRKGSVI